MTTPSGKPGEEFVHHNEQSHVGRLVDKLALGFRLKCVDDLLRRLFAARNAQHPTVDVILFKGLGILVKAYDIRAQLRGIRRVEGYELF